MYKLFLYKSTTYNPKVLGKNRYISKSCGYIGIIFLVSVLPLLDELVKLGHVLIVHHYEQQQS